ncbi:MAG TPA: hypothetical protein VF252_03145 [Gemmatimonadales bacterium]
MRLALLALAGTRQLAVGASPTETCFKLRGRGAFGRDTQAGKSGDKEHYA